MARKVYKKTTLLFYENDENIHEYVNALAEKQRCTMRSVIMNILDDYMKANPIENPKEKVRPELIEWS
jgi:hypothetical protein